MMMHFSQMRLTDGLTFILKAPTLRRGTPDENLFSCC